MVYTMFITLFLYYLWFFVKNSFESAKIAKKTEYIYLISWPDARRPSARLQGRLSRMRRVSRAVQSPRTPQSPAGRYAASPRDARWKYHEDADTCVFCTTNAFEKEFSFLSYESFRFFYVYRRNITP